MMNHDPAFQIYSTMVELSTLLRQVNIFISDMISYVECTDGHCQNLKRITTKSIQGHAK